MSIINIFKQPSEFKIGANALEDIPASDLPEVSLIGRSNVGKSSLLNAITNRKSLARTSQSPGCTRQLNFFAVGEKLFLVDLPGYGYAQASKRAIKGWNNLIKDYLRGRVQLRRIFMLVDARRGLKENDSEMLEFLGSCAVVVQVVLTKADKISKKDLASVLDATTLSIVKHAICYPEVLVTSTKSGWGIEEVQHAILVSAGLDDSLV